MSARSAARAALLLALVQVVACGPAREGSPRLEALPPPGEWQEAVAEAAASGDPGPVEALLERGLAPGVILPVAAAENASELVRLLLSRGADPLGLDASRALFAALVGEHSEVAAILTDAGATLDSPDGLGLTLAHAAATRGRTADLRRLLALGADGELATNTGVTPLMSAAGKGRGRAVALLLAARVEVDARDRDGWSALHYAASGGKTAVARLLLAIGAAVGNSSELGWTPLQLACRAGAGELVEELLAAGADPNIESHAAGPPLLLAARSGDRRAVKALLAAGASADIGHDGEAFRRTEALRWAEWSENEPLTSRLRGSN